MKGIPNIRLLDRFLGRGSAAVTVPPLDGGLKPNNVLEDLPLGIAGTAPDDLALWQGAPIWSDGARLMGAAGEVITAGAEITAIAASEACLALASDDGGLRLLDAELGDMTPKLSAPVHNVTALAFAPDGGLWFTTGSEKHAPKEWRRDLLEKNRAGLLGRVDPASGEVRVVQRRLAYPAGLAIRADGRIVVSEAWRSHIVEYDASGQGGQVLLDEIPGYPGRLSPRAAGGFWLAVFAPRSPLIEFVLREPGYRREMLETLHPAHWVAPSYSSGGDFHEPMQGGALKQMGILKPWAPSLSYGLVVGLDDDFVPQESFHSRAGGRRHGITAALETEGALWLAGRGSAETLTLTLGKREDAA